MNTRKEEFANLCHEQWSSWMNYLFSQCEINIHGHCVIPQWAKDRWTRQVNTNYEDLSEDEKNSDRIEADKFISHMINKTNNHEFVLLNSQSGDRQGLFISKLKVYEDNRVPLREISRYSIETGMILKEYYVCNDEVEQRGYFADRLYDNVF